MKKFEIKADNFEIRTGCRVLRGVPAYSASEIFDACFRADGSPPEILASFDTEEEARSAFEADRYREMARTSASKGNLEWLLVGRCFWIEENEYDEEGEFDQGGDVLESSAEPWVREWYTIRECAPKTGERLFDYDDEYDDPEEARETIEEYKANDEDEPKRAEAVRYCVIKHTDNGDVEERKIVQ